MFKNLDRDFTKRFLLVQGFLYLGVAGFLLVAYSPWFWIFFVAGIGSVLIGMGLRFVVRILSWFLVFWVLKSFTGNSFIAFVVASGVAYLVGSLFPQKRMIRDGRKRMVF